MFLSEFRKDKKDNSQATIIASIVLYNIARDLKEEEPQLPDSLSAAEFNRIMANSFDRTPTNISDQNYYIRDQVVTKYFAQQVAT